MFTIALAMRVPFAVSTSLSAIALMAAAVAREMWLGPRPEED